MTGASGLGWGSGAYEYDLDGNRTKSTEAGVTTTYLYDRADQLKQQTIGPTTTAFVYDTQGNMTTKAESVAAVTSALQYDTANRLVKMTDGPSSATYTLDALGRTKSRVIGATTDQYAYVGESETAHQVTTGATITNSIVGSDGGRLAVLSGTTLNWYLFDLHGDAAGQVASGAPAAVRAYRYRPFGEAISPQGSGLASPWGYQGALSVSPNIAASHALLDIGARFYAPSLGAWTQLDTFAGSVQNPLSMNRFLYVEGNPTTLVDPTGHDPSCGQYGNPGSCYDYYYGTGNGSPDAPTPLSGPWNCYGLGCSSPAISPTGPSLSTPTDPAAPTTQAVPLPGDYLSQEFERYARNCASVGLRPNLREAYCSMIEERGPKSDPELIRGLGAGGIFSAAYIGLCALTTVGCIHVTVVLISETVDTAATEGPESLIPSTSFEIGFFLGTLAAGVGGARLIRADAGGVRPGTSNQTAVDGAGAQAAEAGSRFFFVDGELLDATIPTSAGPLGIVSEVSVSGRTLTLSNGAVYGYGPQSQFVNQVGPGVLLGIVRAIARDAARQGYDTLVMRGIRVPGSSSAKPGHVIDRTIDLTKYQ